MHVWLYLLICSPLILPSLVCNPVPCPSPLVTFSVLLCLSESFFALLKCIHLFLRLHIKCTVQRLLSAVSLMACALNALSIAAADNKFSFFIHTFIHFIHLPSLFICAGYLILTTYLLPCCCLGMVCMYVFSKLIFLFWLDAEVDHIVTQHPAILRNRHTVFVGYNFVPPSVVVSTTSIYYQMVICVPFLMTVILTGMRHIVILICIFSDSFWCWVLCQTY